MDSPTPPGAMTTTLVLGGVRSGKSRYAEQLLSAHPVVTYVAPGYPAAGADHEWAARVGRHRSRRPAGWLTVETADVASVIREASTPLLVDCLGMWLTRLIDGIGGWDTPQETSRAVERATRELADAWREAPTDVVAVTNEVGLGVVPPVASGRLFRDELGRLNATIAAMSDQVALVVAGRVLDLSGAAVVLP
ncbi:MAG TPA: bifunctional adenosylcobinamide kinase/adenosylcobinamide-phosphate guanylyltransferase [Intrasporangium sp.]|uniref:bifunctional adenosylcobinamide kinase/adenosylcobinamide-phosphate guanylyltransferase n=1 Tax=Intrasporangium sp. TaxID=1925024 RepID=UPI002D79C63F|nr:bifunctional adenosylcobinamide kinase/adenosylcobinamide-phosphate guanylyltransferase [Intrasporangium sp.]HET7399643.1 bifunctional adenosylcobinamide kinase/adenosylcobinamide-phosphate guanylyltransferase [Intrasporangium sp.]